MREATQQWLMSAEMDLDSIFHIINLAHLTPIVAFHAQQCIEKCFKAVLEEHVRRVPKDHSTLRLYGLIEALVTLDVDTNLLTDLDNLYIDSRYPSDHGLLPSGKPTLADAKEFHEFAKRIYDQINRTY